MYIREELSSSAVLHGVIYGGAKTMESRTQNASAENGDCSAEGNVKFDPADYLPRRTSRASVSARRLSLFTPVSYIIHSLSCAPRPTLHPAASA